jgi:acyl-CoA reductase-like NAD-dependent aldehyde dehydrogenase
MNKPTGKITTEYRQLFIGGQFVAPSGGLEDVINPANEEAFGRAPLGDVGDARKALDAAHRAFEDGAWPYTDRNLRADKMSRLIDRVVERKDEALTLMMLEMGYTRRESEFQLDLGIDLVRRMVEIAREDPIKLLPLIKTPMPNGTTRVGGAIVARDPIGLVVAITPYNAGLFLGLVKIVPALAAGNTVVLKPSPFTPLQTMFLTELVVELDLPPGVFNVVTGGPEVGEALSSDPRVNMVSFTGSDRVGGLIMAQAAPNITKCHLELGGKSALIIRHDVDLDAVLPVALGAGFGQAGQGCACLTRILVDNRVRPALVERLRAAAKGYFKVGDPFEETTTMGPLIREAARQRTENFVQKALAEGATLVAGGKRPEHLTKGFFYEPTIFDNVTPDSYLAQNEVFGPISAIIGFDGDEEAIRIANKSDFGLSGGIMSRDAGAGLEMALKMRTGMVMLNGGAGRMHPDTPFGGYKRSGLGREWGAEGYYEYTQMKSITYPIG